MDYTKDDFRCLQSKYVWHTRSLVSTGFFNFLYNIHIIMAVTKLLTIILVRPYENLEIL